MTEVSRKNLLKWGLLGQVKKEEVIDSCIANVDLPADFKIENETKTWLINNGISSNDQLKIWLKNNGLDIEEWKKFVIRDFKWRSWCKNNFKKDLPSYYLKRKPLLDRVTYSLIRVKDENLALELYLRIKEKEADFSDLSKKFSEGPEAKLGGIVGPSSLKQTHPLLAKILLISEEKQLWAPKKIDNWWIIVRLEKLENTELSSDIESFLSYELGEQFLIKECDSIERKVISIEKNNQ